MVKVATGVATAITGPVGAATQAAAPATESVVARAWLSIVVSQLQS